MEEEVEYILQDYDVSVEVPTVVPTAEANAFEVTFDKNEFVAVGDNIYIPIVSSDEAPWLIDLIDGRVTATYQGNLDSLEQTTLSLNQTIALAQNAQTAYESSIITDANITAAIDTLRTELVGTEGTVTVALATKVTPTEATALANTAISASIAGGDINAKVGELNTAIADGDSANASRIGVVESTVNDPVSGVNATATGVVTLNSSVGIVNGLPDGTGLLGDVEVLKKQNDGKVETFLDTYQVVDAQRDLVTTAEPYASWLAAETPGSIDVRLSHIGDAYIEYVTLVNGSKQYVASYKFIKAAVDSQSPDKTDAEGFTWALITDSATQEAFTAAVNAQASADGKITTFYATRANTPTAEGEGDIWIVSDEGNLQERWNGTAWVAIQDQAIVTNANAITSLNTELNDGTNTWASADSTLETSLNTSISNGDAVVEGKFEYGSSLTINGLTTNVGFGLVNELSSVNGSPGIGDSEFWIDAQRFKFTNSANTGQVSPFTIDATGATPKITFAGIVDFTSTNNDGTSTFDGDNITTGSIVANKINTAGLIAENISANEIIGKTIEGATINGAKINGAVIKASYLDLDGELEVLTNFYLITDTDTSQIPASAVTENRYTLNYVYNISHDSVLIENSNYYRIPSLSTVREANTSINIVSSPFIGLIHAYDTYQVGSNIKAVSKLPILTVTNNTEVFRYDFTIHPAFNSSYINTAGYSTTSFDISLFGESRTLSWNLASMSGNQSGDDSGGQSQYIQSGQVYLGGVLIFNNVTGSYSRTSENDPGTTVVGDSTYTTTIKGVTVNVRLVVNVGFSCSLTMTIPSGTYQSTSEFSNDTLIKFTNNSVSTSATRTNYNAKTSLSMLINNIV